MSLEHLKRMPVSDEDWAASDPDLIRVEWMIDPFWRCRECHRPMRLEVRHYDPPRPLDDTMRARCVVCDGLWECWGRDIATDRAALQNDVLLFNLECWLGPRQHWLNPYLN